MTTTTHPPEKTANENRGTEGCRAAASCSPPRVHHLAWDSQERADLLNDYWQRERLDYLLIHLQGAAGIATHRGCVCEPIKEVGPCADCGGYPYHNAEAKRCRAIYDARAKAENDSGLPTCATRNSTGETKS